MSATVEPRARGGRRRLSNLPKHVVLVVAAALAFGPVLFMLMTALKTENQYLNDTLGPPWPLSFSNFREALHGGDFFIWLKNSAIMTLGSVVVSTLAAALCAYAIARMRFRGQNLLLSVNIALLIVPPVVLLIPLFAQYSDLGLISTYRGVIIIYAGLTAPFSVYLLTSFFRTIPHELLESAMADGASHFRLFWQIVVPLSAPAFVTLVVVNALWVWNELLIALVFLQTDNARTINAGLAQFQGRYSTNQPLILAGALISIAPVVLLYLSGQRFFVRGLTAGIGK